MGGTTRFSLVSEPSQKVEELPPVPKPKQKQEETHDLTFVVPPGISLGLELNDAPDGNEIASVEFGSWAMVMALRPHDRIVRCGSVDVDGASSFGEILAAQRAAQSPGEPLHLIVRAGEGAAAAAAAVPANYDFGPTSAAWRAGGFQATTRSPSSAPSHRRRRRPPLLPMARRKGAKVARRILERQERARAESGGERGLPLPVAAVHATRLVAALLHVQKPGGGVVSVKEASGAAWRGAAVKQPWALADSRDALHLLIATALEYLEAQSRRAPPECGPSSSAAPSGVSSRCARCSTAAARSRTRRCARSSGWARGRASHTPAAS